MLSPLSRWAALERVRCGIRRWTCCPAHQTDGVQNADCLLREQQVIAELKILQTEFFDPLLIRVGQAAAKLIRDPTDEALDLFERFVFLTLEAPLKRIIKKPIVRSRKLRVY
jgi:hypothetical protein